MFYSQFILAKKGPLGTIWIAAHLERKLRKNQVADTDIGVSVDSIIFPDVPIALRLSSHLLLGVVRIYSRKVNYLFDDCSEALLKVKQAFSSTAVDLPPEESKAPYHSITLPETFDLDDFELPDTDIFKGNYVDHHVSSRDQITLQDPMDSVAYSTSKFGLDERFGDGDTSGLDLEEELFLDNGAATGDAGVSADAQVSVQPMTPLKQDELRDVPAANSESMIEGAEGDTDFVEYAQAPRTPGLAEAPNLPNIQETSACDDHLEAEYQHPTGSVMKGDLQNVSGGNDVCDRSSLPGHMPLPNDAHPDAVLDFHSEKNGCHSGAGQFPAPEVALECVPLDNNTLASGTPAHVDNAPLLELTNETVKASDDPKEAEINLNQIFNNDKVDISSHVGLHKENACNIPGIDFECVPSDNHALASRTEAHVDPVNGPLLELTNESVKASDDHKEEEINLNQIFNNDKVGKSSHVGLHNDYPSYNGINLEENACNIPEVSFECVPSDNHALAFGTPAHPVNAPFLLQLTNETVKVSDDPKEEDINLNQFFNNDKVDSSSHVGFPKDYPSYNRINLEDNACNIPGLMKFDFSVSLDVMQSFQSYQTSPNRQESETYQVQRNSSDIVTSPQFHILKPCNAQNQSVTSKPCSEHLDPELPSDVYGLYPPETSKVEISCASEPSIGPGEACRPSDNLEQISYENHMAVPILCGNNQTTSLKSNALVENVTSADFPQKNLCNSGLPNLPAPEKSFSVPGGSFHMEVPILRGNNQTTSLQSNSLVENVTNADFPQKNLSNTALPNLPAPEISFSVPGGSFHMEVPILRGNNQPTSLKSDALVENVTSTDFRQKNLCNSALPNLPAPEKLFSVPGGSFHMEVPIFHGNNQTTSLKSNALVENVTSADFPQKNLSNSALPNLPEPEKSFSVPGGSFQTTSLKSNALVENVTSADFPQKNLSNSALPTLPAPEKSFSVPGWSFHMEVPILHGNNQTTSLKSNALVENVTSADFPPKNLSNSALPTLAAPEKLFSVPGGSFHMEVPILRGNNQTTSLKSNAIVESVTSADFPQKNLSNSALPNLPAPEKLCSVPGGGLHMEVPILYGNNQTTSVKSNALVDNVSFADFPQKNLGYSALPNLPAPEKLLSVPGGIVDLPRGVLLQDTPVKSGRINVTDAGDSKLMSGRKRSYTKSTLTEKSPNSFESSRKIRFRTTKYIREDEDFLSSILAGKRSSTMKLKPTPPYEITSAKRRRFAQTIVLKRKVLMDENMVLHGDAIREQLTNTEDIRRVRKRAPCTCPEISVIQKQLLEDEIFSEPILTGVSMELGCLHKRTFDLVELKIIKNPQSATPFVNAAGPKETSMNDENTKTFDIQIAEKFDGPHATRENEREGTDELSVTGDDGNINAVLATNMQGESHNLTLDDNATQMRMGVQIAEKFDGPHATRENEWGTDEPSVTGDDGNINAVLATNMQGDSHNLTLDDNATQMRMGIQIAEKFDGQHAIRENKLEGTAEPSVTGDDGNISAVLATNMQGESHNLTLDDNASQMRMGIQIAEKFDGQHATRENKLEGTDQPSVTGDDGNINTVLATNMQGESHNLTLGDNATQMLMESKIAEKFNGPHATREKEREGTDEPSVTGDDANTNPILATNMQGESHNLTLDDNATQMLMDIQIAEKFNGPHATRENESEGTGEPSVTGDDDNINAVPATNMQGESHNLTLDDATQMLMDIQIAEKFDGPLATRENERAGTDEPSVTGDDGNINAVLATNMHVESHNLTLDDNATQMLMDTTACVANANASKLELSGYAVDAGIDQTNISLDVENTASAGVWFPFTTDGAVGALADNSNDGNINAVLATNMHGESHNLTLDDNATQMLMDATADVAKSNASKLELSGYAVDAGIDQTNISLDVENTASAGVWFPFTTDGAVGALADNSTELLITACDVSKDMDASVQIAASCMPTDHMMGDQDFVRTDMSSDKLLNADNNLREDNTVHNTEIEIYPRAEDSVSLDLAQVDAVVEVKTYEDISYVECDPQVSTNNGICGEQPSVDFSCSAEVQMPVQDYTIDVGEIPSKQETHLQSKFNAEVSVNEFNDPDVLNVSYAVNDTGFLNEDGEEEIEAAKDYILDAGGARLTDNSGWSSRTRAVAKYLQIAFTKETEYGRNALSMDSLLVGKTRKEACRMFFEALVLKTKDYVHVEQAIPFDDITVKPRMQLMKSEF